MEVFLHLLGLCPDSPTHADLLGFFIDNQIINQIKIVWKLL